LEVPEKEALFSQLRIVWELLYRPVAIRSGRRRRVDQDAVGELKHRTA
jgi:hypothetical protein